LPRKRAIIPTRISEAKTQINLADRKLAEAQTRVVAGDNALSAARRAWFGRTHKVARATNELASANGLVTQLQESLAAWQKHESQLQANLRHVEKVFVEQRQICEKLPPRTETEQQLKSVEAQLIAITAELADIQAKLDHLLQQLVSQSKALFCTLTKNYCAEELKGQQFSAVIIDEISMALPPLIFLAAARANSRVILVGDFWQLPPITRSKDITAKERLGQDTFHLTGIAKDNQASDSAAILTALKTQQRMRSPIANVARELAYGHSRLLDHNSVFTRKEKEWLQALPQNPLVVVDTAELNSWCGREAGSLSRFNFNSTTS
jgi:hypothetical protein